MSINNEDDSIATPTLTEHPKRHTNKSYCSVDAGRRNLRICKFALNSLHDHNLLIFLTFKTHTYSLLVIAGSITYKKRAS